GNAGTVDDLAFLLRLEPDLAFDGLAGIHVANLPDEPVAFDGGGGFTAHVGDAGRNRVAHDDVGGATLGGNGQLSQELSAETDFGRQGFAQMNQSAGGLQT